MSTALHRLLGLLRRPRVRAALAAGAGGAWLASGLYAVPATSLGVVRLLGAVRDAAAPPGLHWTWPWPLGRVERAPVTRTFALALGVRPAADGRPEGSDPVEGRWLTGDTNILYLRSKLSWTIADPARFLYGVEDPERLLRVAAGTAFSEATSGLAVDDVLTSERLMLREQVRSGTQSMLDAWGSGIRVLAVEIEVVEPPPPVLAAFQGVQNARADRERLVSEAESYANQTIPLARGEAEKVVSAALAFREGRLATAQGDAGRFARLAREHARAPALLERRLYLETAERVLPRVRRYVLDPGGEASLPIRLIE